MERLTEWYDDGEHKGVMVKEARGEYVLKTLFDELDEGYLGMCELKAYEDTGLTPEQIRELKERDKSCKVKINAGVPTCPVCGRRIVKCYDFCPDCGQRLRWED